MPQWSAPISLVGHPGLSVLSGNGAPPANTGAVGQPGWLDVQFGRLYGAKTSSGWPTSYLQLQLASQAGTLPNDLTGNSLVISPIQGDSTAVQIQILNSAGNAVFTCDASGDTTIAGTLNVTGLATLPSLNATSVTATNVTTLTLQDVRGDLQVEGHTTVADLKATSAAVSGALQAGSVSTGDVEAGVVNATGAISAQSVQAINEIAAAALSAENITIGSAADEGKNTSNGLFHGNLAVHGDSQLTTLEATAAQVTSLNVSGATTLTGALASGAISAPSLTLNLPSSGGASLPFNIVNSQGKTVLSSDPNGNFSLAGTLNIAGSESSGALQTSALTAASIVNTGNTKLQGTLEVDSASTLAQVTTGALEASSAKIDGGLTVAGSTGLQALTATDVSTSTLETIGNASIGAALAVAGGSTLQALTAAAIQATSATLSAGVTANGGLSVGGASSLQALTAASTTLSSLHVTGTSALDGALAAGATTIPQLTIKLPTSGGSSTPIAVSDGSGNSLMTLTSGGQMTILGQLVVNGGNASGAETLGALTVSSFLDQGNGEIQGNFKVDGTTGLQAVTATDVSTGTLEASAAATFAKSVSVTGALSSASLTTGSSFLSSVETHGLKVDTDSYGNGGTLTVSVQANLPTTVTADLHASSLNVSNGTSLAGNLGVSGSSSLASLTVSGGTSVAALTSTALNATTGSFSGALSTAGTLSASGAISGQSLVVQGSANLPLQALDANSNTLLSLDGSGNLAIKGTLSVSGQATGQANNLGAVTVTSFSDTGSAQISQNLQVNGGTTLASLSVSGASTLGSTTLGTTTAGDITANSLTTTKSVVVGTTLSVSAATSLAALTAAAISAQSLTTQAAVSVGSTLSVSSATSLAALTAGASTLSSLQVSNNAQVGGTLAVTGAASLAAGLTVTGSASISGTATVSGALTAPSVSVMLPSSGASSTPVQVKTSNNSNLLSLDASGNLTIAGAINAAGGTSSGGAVSATSISDSGALTVQGASSLQAVTVTQLTNSGASQAASLKIQLPSSNPANLPINLLSSGNNSLFSVDSTGDVLAAGTLGVTGAASLSTLATSGAATLASATVSGALSAGATTLNSLSVSNGGTIAGALAVAGSTSAARFIATSAGSSSNPLLQFTATGSGTNYLSGIYSDSNYGQWYEYVTNALVRSVTYSNGTPANTGSNYVTHNFYSSIATQAGGSCYRFNTGNGLALNILGNSAAAFSSTLSVGGLLTSAGVTLSSGALTFADGTSLTTATVQNQAAYTATSAGAAATPAFRFSGGTNPSGLFFDTAPGNVMVSVNGYKSLYSTAASGAAQGANGWAIASTLGSGSNLLALYGGGSTTTPVYAIDGTGAVTAASQTLGGPSSAASYTATGTVTGANLTISASGGKLTFGDGTTMTTAATGSGGSSSGGSASQFVATSQGTVSAPAYTQTSNSNTGTYFTGSGSTSALQVAANGVNVAQFNSSGLTLPSGNGGKVTFADGTSQSTAFVGNVLPQMTNLATAYGTPAQFVGTMGTTANTSAAAMFFNGTNIPHQFTPQTNTAVTGLTVSNFSSVTVYFYLYDLTAGQAVYGYNGGNGIAANTSASVTYANSTYPLTAGHTYQWQAIRSTSGAASIQVNPQYLVPSGAPSSLSYYNPFVVTSSTTVAKGGAIATNAPGLGQLGYYKNASSSYLYFIEAYIAGSGVSDIYLYNLNTSANQFVQDSYGYTTLSSTLTRYTFGPFNPQTWPFVANNQYSLSFYAPSGNLTITSAIVTLTIGQ